MQELTHTSYIPPEIRLMILTPLLARECTVPIYGRGPIFSVFRRHFDLQYPASQQEEALQTLRKDTSSRPPPHYFAPVMVCRLLYQEAAPIYYNHNEFAYVSTTAFNSRFSRVIGRANTDCVAKLTISYSVNVPWARLATMPRLREFGILEQRARFLPESGSRGTPKDIPDDHKKLERLCKARQTLEKVQITLYDYPTWRPQEELKDWIKEKLWPLNAQLQERKEKREKGLEHVWQNVFLEERPRKKLKA